jgi:peptidoglycan/xylan/chitin deacetylase (PgdA/CDA1 family)
MLNFKNINILFISLLVITIGLNMAYSFPVYVYIMLLMVYASLLFYGCYYIGSNFFIHVICNIKTDKKTIAFSFDDGPDAVNTPQILQVLKNNDAKAAFFCIGSKIDENKDLLKQAYNDDHMIGNHSFSHHFWFDMFSTKKMIADMQMADNATNSAIGKKPK